MEQMIRMRSTMAQPKGFKFCCMEEYVLKNGKQFLSSQVDNVTRTKILAKIISLAPFQMKECFYNAQKIAVNIPAFKYVEGYCLTDIGFPILHGWNVWNGKVIDTTLRLKQPRSSYANGFTDRVIGEFDPPREYYGVTFRRDFILKRMLVTKEWSSVLDDWKQNYILIRSDPSGTRIRSRQ